MSNQQANNNQTARLQQQEMDILFGQAESLLRNADTLIENSNYQNDDYGDNYYYDDEEGDFDGVTGGQVRILLEHIDKCLDRFIEISRRVLLTRKQMDDLQYYVDELEKCTIEVADLVDNY